MKTIVKMVSFLALTLCSYVFVAQSNYLQINLEIKNSKKKNQHVRFSLYQDSLFYLATKTNPAVDLKDPQTWLERDADTIIKINKSDFEKVVGMLTNLSPSKILNGMNPTNPSIGNDGSIVTLNVGIGANKISYSIWSPTNNTKERNLEQFLSICKEILSLSKRNVKDFM